MNKFYFISAANFGLALFLGTTLTLSSCSEAEEVINPEKSYSKVHTRAVENPADLSSIGALTLAFYNDAGTEVRNVTQWKADAADFGDFSLSLPIGTYTMVAIGRSVVEGDDFTLTSPTEAGYTSNAVRETFAATQRVEVTSAAAMDLSVELHRVVSKLGIESTDVRPEGISKIRTTYGAGSKAFSPTTGLAVGNAGFSVVDTPSAAVGETMSVSNFAFLATDEQTMDITIEVLDADDQVLFTRVVPDVPFKRNRQTILRGPLFGTSLTCTFTIETFWLDDIIINF